MFLSVCIWTTRMRGDESDSHDTWPTCNLYLDTGQRDMMSLNTQRGVSVQSPSYTLVLGGQMFILCRLVSEAAAKVCVVTGSSLCGRRLSFSLKSHSYSLSFTLWHQHNLTDVHFPAVLTSSEAFAHFPNPDVGKQHSCHKVLLRQETAVIRQQMGAWFYRLIMQTQHLIYYRGGSGEECLLRLTN